MAFNPASSLSQLLLLLLLAAAAAAESTAEADADNVEDLWSLSDEEFNGTLASVALNVSAELLKVQDFSAFFGGYASVNLTAPLLRLQRVMRMTETLVFQLNVSAAAVRADTLVATLQQISDSLRFDWTTAVGEKSLESCHSHFLSRVLAIEAEAAVSLPRMWAAARSDGTGDRRREFQYMTGAYHSDLSSRLVRLLTKAETVSRAKSSCTDGSLQRLYELFVGSARLLVRAEAVRLGRRQLGESPSPLESLADLQSQWRRQLQQVADAFSGQLVALWRSDYRDGLVSDVEDLLGTSGSPTPALADAVVSRLRQKYFYVRYAWLQLPPLPLAPAGLLIWPTASEFVCFSRPAFAEAATLVLLCRNGRLSQGEEAAAAAEWQRLRDAADAASRDVVPPTLKEAVAGFRPDAADSAAGILGQLVTPRLMGKRLPGAGNTSFLAVKMATVAADRTVLVRSADDTFAVARQAGRVWHLASPVQLTWEHVPHTPSPKAAARTAAHALAAVLLLLTLPPLLLPD